MGSGVRRSSGPKARRMILTYPGPCVILSPRDKVHADRARAERDHERQAFEAARRLERRLLLNPNACSVCGRPISAADSLARGVGPVCNDRARHAAQEEDSF